MDVGAGERAGVRVAAVVPAAGLGLRLGAGGPKAFVEVGGLTLLRRSVDGLRGSGVVDRVVVVVAPELVTAAGDGLPDDVLVTGGGAQRSDSVRAGLAALEPLDPTHVLIHDAARALTPAILIRSVVARLREGVAAVVPVLPVADTVKVVTADGVITSTPERDSLRAVQTPQGFTAGVLRRAYEGELVATDDAGLVERTGVAVHTVPGDPLAFKITTAHDLLLARALLAAP